MKPSFKYFHLPVKSRYIIAFIIYLIVALSQFIIMTGTGLHGFIRFGGIVLLAAACVILYVKRFSNKPVDLGKEDWKPVSLNEVDRLADKMRSIKKAKISFIYTAAFGVLLSFCFVFLLLIALMIGGTGTFFIVLDLYLLFFPLLWFARIDKWYPGDFAAKLSLFNPVLSAHLPPELKLNPMLRFDEDKEGREIPEDIRLSISFKPGKGPEDFQGAQFQLTYNDGPNGRVPYIYAVFLTKGQGKSLQRLTSGDALKYPGFVGEDVTKKGDEYGSVVLRQDTKKRSDGYHTTEKDITLLTESVIETLLKLV